MQLVCTGTPLQNGVFRQEGAFSAFPHPREDQWPHCSGSLPATPGSSSGRPCSPTGRSASARGEFLVQGVRPITLAADRAGRSTSSCSTRAPRCPAGRGPAAPRAGAEEVAWPPTCWPNSARRTRTPPELIASWGMPAGRPTGSASRTTSSAFCSTARPARATSVPYPLGGRLRRRRRGRHRPRRRRLRPKTVRASTGSLFALPAVRVPSHREVTGWLDARQAPGPSGLVGTDEHGTADVVDFDFCRPTLLAGRQRDRGLSTAWREACDHLVSIPIDRQRPAP